MDIHARKGMVEALAPFLPKTLDHELWEFVRDDAIELVVASDPRDEKHGRQLLSHLCLFLAEVMPLRPGLGLAELLRVDEVEGHLHRLIADGRPHGTMGQRQAALNSLIRTKEGRRGRTTRSRENHFEPYGGDLDVAWHKATDGVGGRNAVVFLRVVAAGVAGLPLPETRSTDTLDVHIDDNGRVLVDGRAVTVRWPVPTQAAGPVDRAAIDRAKRWAWKYAGLRLDRRRLVLTHLTDLVATTPAIEAISLEGVGRDRLTSAVEHATRPHPDTVAGLLRNA